MLRLRYIARRPPPPPALLEIPRWMQLVRLPLLLVLIWVVAGAVRHAVFIFLVALLIALLLNPLVRGLGRVWIPRGLAVAIVYLGFAAFSHSRSSLSRRSSCSRRAGKSPRRQLLYGRVRTPRGRARSTISRACSSGSITTT